MHDLSYLATASPEVIAIYKKRRCTSCLWEKPCKKLICQNGLYSNLHDLVYGFKNEQGQLEEWLVDRQAYYEREEVIRLMKLTHDNEIEAVEFQLQRQGVKNGN